ncbi:MASE1 domain-containing protein [Luteibacter anthropi]|uniref:MASE1 domain-containing protein n=1 Tax=Luteibacter anthropi TaxID=564369 RepID=A0A7X5UBG9_9GAMM|nr:MASE1 domain-containing protein [Luteibacter anthropi]NII07178.1 hypothetical protein [Luteibacter anthropi]
MKDATPTLNRGNIEWKFFLLLAGEAGVKGSTAQGNVSAIHWAHWGQHFAIAAAYAACYELARYVSFPQWLLTAGLRLACLLLLPVRFWPALALGEGLPLLEEAALCASKFGTGWAIAQSVPMVVLWMALLKPMRLRWALHDEHGQVRMSMILAASLGTSIITASATSIRLMLALQHTPGKWPDIGSEDFFAYLLGAYLGALTLTPVVLALCERIHACRGETISLGTIWRSQLLRDVLWWTLPVVTGLVWMTLATHDEGIRQITRLALLPPVIGLAWRHGWHGAAVGGMVASVALAMTAHGALDPETIRVQVILALTISSCLWIGAYAARRSGSLIASASLKR